MQQLNPSSSVSGAVLHFVSHGRPGDAVAVLSRLVADLSASEE